MTYRPDSQNEELRKEQATHTSENGAEAKQILGNHAFDLLKHAAQHTEKTFSDVWHGKATKGEYAEALGEAIGAGVAFDLLAGTTVVVGSSAVAAEGAVAVVNTTAIGIVCNLVPTLIEAAAVRQYFKNRV